MRTRTKLAAIAVVAAALVGVTGCTFQNTSPPRPARSEDKGVTISNKQTVYKVWTDCGVFAVEDSLAHGNFNSADLYGSLEKGHTYKLETYGPRNGFFSMFPNIVSAQEVSQ